MKIGLNENIYGKDSKVTHRKERCTVAKIIFITGGASSGKSRWAVTHFAGCDNVLYMSIMSSLDADTSRRIEYNCREREIEWNVKTNADNIAELVKGQKFSVLDSLAAYVNRAAYRKCPDYSDMNDMIRKEIEQQVIEEIIEVMTNVRESYGNMIIISTELGFCPIPSQEDARWFREILGNVNQRIANLSNEVHLSASGITFKIKG
ncbi:MAG: bifunctional adenosylcobinamide kinase/adenosylcobinamide-phosphate guanylyltransferase [Oscillospiraceae bacterium]|nr:bifunctional adenosylcobinamide kinase/adenosylcobinamide-phosphate guanylyltransferase [Oscillospiraceae bacterium]